MCCLQKLDLLPGMQLANNSHLCETLIIHFRAMQARLLVEFLKSSTPTMKTFYYLYILLNKEISVHWLQVT